MVGKIIWIIGFRIHMQYLLCVVCFRVWDTTRKVFMADVMDTILANHKVFTQRHAHDAEVTSM
jgi:hypothetical protein